MIRCGSSSSVAAEWNLVKVHFNLKKRSEVEVANRNAVRTLTFESNHIFTHISLLIPMKLPCRTHEVNLIQHYLVLQIGKNWTFKIRKWLLVIFKPGGVVKHCGWCDVGTVLGERRWGLGMVKSCQQFSIYVIQGVGTFRVLWKGFTACDFSVQIHRVQVASKWYPLDLWPQVFQHAVQLAWRQLPHCHSFGFVAFHPQAVKSGVACCDAFQGLECSTVCLCRLCTPRLYMHRLCMQQVGNEYVRTSFPYVLACHKSWLQCIWHAIKIWSHVRRA